MADETGVANGDPRSEDPAAVRAEVLIGCPDATEIADRGQAIATAINWSGAGDVLLIAGKGHETGQEIAGVTLPFDDRDVARRVLAGGKP